MENIIEPHSNFDFTKLSLGVLSSIQGGAYFTKIFFENKPLYIQTPTCSTKQGFLKHGKKIYSDLMFNNNDEIFINWLENLETKCQQLIYEKADAWFSSENKLELNDIESAFTSPIKTFKSGKFYLLRVNAKPTLPIYGESQSTLKFEEVSVESSNISILEIHGIKFTSRNFQIEIELKQTMIVSPDPFLENCFIKKPIVKRVAEIDKHIVSTSSINENENNNVKQTEITIKTDNLPANNSLGEVNKKSEVSTDSNLTEEEVDKIVSEQMKELDLMEDIEAVSELAKPTQLKTIKTKAQSATIVSNDIDPESDLDIKLEIEDLNHSKEEKSNDSLTEIDIHLDSSLESITLKKPNHVYYEIYNQARIKAKEAKKNAIKAYLEAKNIKKTYMLEDIDDSDDSDEDIEDSDYSDAEYSDEEENDNEDGEISAHS
jgi:hypothetical protein